LYLYSSLALGVALGQALDCRDLFNAVYQFFSYLDAKVRQTDAIAGCESTKHGTQVVKQLLLT
jgi:hypothetical protein